VVNDSANAADWSIRANLQVNDLVYGDRTYVIKTLPPVYVGFDWIRTATDSKAYTGATLVSFKIAANSDVLVAFDDRVTSKPAWLTSGWTDTGNNIVDSEATPVTFSVYNKVFAANTTVFLGPNGQTSGCVLYLVIVKPTGATPPPTPTPTPTITTVPPTPTPTPTPTQTPIPTLPSSDKPIGFASVNAMGNNGTTGGAGGQTVTATTTSQLLDYISRPEPLIIRVQGTITLSAGSTLGMYDVASDKTIIGVGANATITGGGFNIGLPIDDKIISPPANAIHNVIIRNLRMTGSPDDLINVMMFSHHIWIDHCDFSISFDGCVDIKRGSDFCTVSWNHFHDHIKTCLLGHDDNNGAQDIGRLRVTYHHNFFNATSQRHPRTRFSALCHVYNNYYYENAYAVVAAMSAKVLMENNYIYSVNNPGRVVFSGEEGYIVQRDNILIDCNHPIEERGPVPEASTYYNYTLDDVNQIPTIVPAGAGVGKIGY
jgi:pectate lyase